jgi:hypothetical protein
MQFWLVLYLAATRILGITLGFWLDGIFGMLVCYSGRLATSARVTFAHKSVRAMEINSGWLLKPFSDGTVASASTQCAG